MLASLQAVKVIFVDALRISHSGFVELPTWVYLQRIAVRDLR